MFFKWYFEYFSFSYWSKKKIKWKKGCFFLSKLVFFIQISQNQFRLGKQLLKPLSGIWLTSFHNRCHTFVYLYLQINPIVNRLCKTHSHKIITVVAYRWNHLIDVLNQFNSQLSHPVKRMNQCIVVWIERFFFLVKWLHKTVWELWMAHFLLWRNTCYLFTTI